MGVFDYIKNKFTNQATETKVQGNDIDIKTINEIFQREVASENIGEVTYFICMKMLGESLGKLPLKLYKETNNGVEKATNDIAKLLKLRPNPYLTSSMFWTTIEYYRNHYGNAYAWCRWQGSKLKDLWILEPKNITPLIDNKGFLGNENALYYKYLDPVTSETYIFDEKDILHFKTSITTKGGILGLAVQDILKNNMEGNKASQSFMNRLYKSGLTAKAVLEYTGDLDDTALNKLLATYEKFANGVDNTGKIVPVPLGMKLTPLDIKLTDSQFFELKKYSSLQIAAAFGIKPNHLNDYTKSSYANSEMQNLSFYVDTLLFVLTQYEQELTYKLLSEEERNKDNYYFKFNVNAILRVDFKTQMESFATGINNGIYSINQAKEFLELPRVEGGDVTIVNGNYIPIGMVGKQYMKGGDKSE